MRHGRFTFMLGLLVAVLISMLAAQSAGAAESATTTGSESATSTSTTGSATTTGSSTSTTGSSTSTTGSTASTDSGTSSSCSSSCGTSSTPPSTETPPITEQPKPKPPVDACATESAPATCTPDTHECGTSGEAACPPKTPVCGESGGPICPPKTPVCGEDGQPACPECKTAAACPPPKTCVDTATVICHAIDIPTCESSPGLASCNHNRRPTDKLPFTGPGDIVLALILALLAGTGGMLFLFGASGREEIEGLNRRSMESPSGFRIAYRELLKRQVGD